MSAAEDHFRSLSDAPWRPLRAHHIVGPGGPEHAVRLPRMATARPPEDRSPALRIRELADQTGTTPLTIRYYEPIGLLPAAERQAGGQRRYGADDVRRLVFTRCCRESGFTIEQVRGLAALAENDSRRCTDARVAGLLTHVETAAAGRAYTADSGVYSVASISWLWAAKSVGPDRADVVGAGLALLGAVVILHGRAVLRAP